MDEQGSMVKQVVQLTEQKLEWLQKRAPENTRKALLASLRNGVGHSPGEDPKLWGVLLQNMPERMQGKDVSPSRQENAIFSALTLYAVHQQGWDVQKHPMHTTEQSFGTAVAKMIPPGDEDAKERVERRFTRAATSIDLREFTHHLRGLVQQLSAAGIPLNWALLAGDLYRYQNPDWTAGVRLRWGEDFYSAIHYKADEAEDKKEEEV